MISKKDMPLCEAANYFKEEILEIMPDIPVTQLADMVSLYIYYQYGITREEAKKLLKKPVSENFDRLNFMLSLTGQLSSRLDYFYE